MITALLGKVGAGKSASMIREMLHNPTNMPTFTNIKTYGIANVYQITADMIIRRELLRTKKNGEKVYKYSVNQEFWQAAVKKFGAIRIVLDEIQNIANARRSMSSVNKVVNEWLSMTRRVVGDSPDGRGEMFVIAQMDAQLDSILKGMATSARYHVMHYQKLCHDCHHMWSETNETSEPLWVCPACGAPRQAIVKCNHVIEVWHFASMGLYQAWNEMGRPRRKCYHSHYMINDIESVFDKYDTIQWENMINDFEE